MRKKELIDRIGEQTGIKKAMINAVLTAFFKIIFYELCQQHSIRIGNLGTLRYVQSISRNGFNPLKQRLEVFKGKNKIKFIPSKGLGRIINPAEED